MVRCPICQRKFDPKDSSAMPFCCERCRLVDLGRWLGEKYAVPEPREESQGEEPEEKQTDD